MGKKFDTIKTLLISIILLAIKKLDLQEKIILNFLVNVNYENNLMYYLTD